MFQITPWSVKTILRGLGDTECFHWLSNFPILWSEFNQCNNFKNKYCIFCFSGKLADTVLTMLIGHYSETIMPYLGHHLLAYMACNYFKQPVSM